MSLETGGWHARSIRTVLVGAMLCIAVNISGTSANDVLGANGNDPVSPKDPGGSAQGTVVRTPDGRVEIGWTRGGLRDGNWTIRWPDGLFESGRYSEDRRTGEWTVLHPDGGRMEKGEYVDGGHRRRMEKGEYVDGRRHGLWTIGPIDSFGTHSYQLFSAPGEFFDSEVNAERLFSLGTPVGPWVVRYDGHWNAEGSHIDERGRLQGQWQVWWRDGLTARGLMLDSAQHGEWEVRNSIGTHARGTYCNGVLCGQWTIRWYDGVREHGSFCGQGVKCLGWKVLWPDGMYEQGPYDKGRRHGEWKIVLPGGVLEQGSYEHGQRHGSWKVEWPDGTSESGAFDRGKRSGTWVYRQGKDHTSGRYEDGRVVGDWIYRFRLRRVKEYGEVIKERCGKAKGYMCAPYGAMALSVTIEHWDILNPRQRLQRAYDDMKEIGGHVGSSNSQWMYYFADGGSEMGQLIADRRSGHWIRWYPDGRLVEGRYTNGASQGRWRTRFPDGTVSSGEVGNHRIAHGRWQIRDRGAVVQQGLYIAGKKEGLWETVPLDRGSWRVWMKAGEEPPIQWR